jgi:hypothetical protein
MTATLGINDQVNETLGITVELEVMSEAADFIKQIFLFLAYGGNLNLVYIQIQNMIL